MKKKASSPQNTKDPEKAKSDILQAALEVFSEKGFDAATTRDIAGRADMSHGIIRYHYTTKENLWHKAVAYLLENMERETYLTDKQIEQMVSGDKNVFRLWLRMYVNYCAYHPEHARIIMQESVSSTARLAKAVDIQIRDYHLRSIEVIKALQAYGILPANSPIPSLMYIITGACQNIFALAAEAKLSLNYDPMTSEAIEAHAETIIAIFVPYD